MPTYRDIQEDVKKLHGRTVKTCWIAHVKELNGLPGPGWAHSARQISENPRWFAQPANLC